MFTRVPGPLIYLLFLASLGQTTADELTYRFTAKIDFKGLLK